MLILSSVAQGCPTCVPLFLCISLAPLCGEPTAKEREDERKREETKEERETSTKEREKRGDERKVSRRGSGAGKRKGFEGGGSSISLAGGKREEDTGRNSVSRE